MGYDSPDIGTEKQKQNKTKTCLLHNTVDMATKLKLYNGCFFYEVNGLTVKRIKDIQGEVEMLTLCFCSQHLWK